MVARSSFPSAAVIGLALVCAQSPALGADDYPNEIAAKAKPLSPVSNWALDYGENQCRLARIFGTDDDQHLLYIDQGWPGHSFSLSFAGSSFKRYRRDARAQIGLQSDAPMLRFRLPPVGEMGRFGPAVILASVGVSSGKDSAIPRLRVGTSDEPTPTSLVSAALDPSEGAKIDRIVLKRGGNAVTYETGNMRGAFEALNTCTADLLEDWGLDPEKHLSFAPAKWLNRDKVVSQIQRRYPPSALNDGEQAIFQMRAIIDETGRVESCKIFAATSADKLVSPACDAMMGARFEPAQDDEGQPMRSFYASTVSYRIGL